MANKINKKHTEDLFAGLKYVDNMLNEAAGLKKEPILSLEERLKMRLTESTLSPAMENSTADISMEDSAMEMETLSLPGEEDFSTEYDYQNDEYITNTVIDEIDQDLAGVEPEGELDQDLYEALLKEDEDLELAVAEPSVDEPSIESGEELSMDTEMGADTEIGVDADLEMSMDDSAVDMGAPAMSGMDMSMDTELDATEEPMAAVEPALDVQASPENIDDLIDGLLQENQELSDLGYEHLGDEDLTTKVKNTAGPKIQLETPTDVVATAMTESETPKSTKLDTEELTSTVKGASEKNKSGDPTQANKDLKFTNANTEDLTSKIKDEKGNVLTQATFDKIKTESKLKDKALVNLAERYVALENEFKKIKFENYKAKKVNAILTLLPELKQNTRETLVSRFDEAVNTAQVNKLYTDVSKLVKENKRPSINEAVSKANKGIKAVIVEGTTKTEGTEEQSRKDLLMGIGGKDQYFKY